MTSPLANLFDVAQAEFGRLRDELAGYGLALDPGLELRQGEGLLCYYDLGDGHIYLSLPDPSTGLGRFQAVVFREILGCADDGELATLIRLQLPWLLAHEVAHCFRHRRGLFGEDLWFEEQVANQFAAAVVKYRLDPTDYATLTGLLQRSLAHLTPRVPSGDIALASFLDPVQALGAAGILRRGTVRNLEVLQELFGHSAEAILRDIPLMPTEMRAALDRRQGEIAGLNTSYTSEMARYVYLQFGWMLLELRSPERPYVDGVAREHLGAAADVLLAPTESRDTPDAAIAACFDAHRALRDRGDRLGRYFLKRYRALLLGRVAEATRAAGGRDMQVDLSYFIESDDDDADGLDALTILAPQPLRALFPAALSAAPPSPDPGPHLPHPSDRRLFALSQGADDGAAAGARARLEQLEHSEVFRGLSAELQLALVAVMHRVRVAAGDSLIWQGNDNEDVFLITSGEFEAIVDTPEGPAKVGQMGPGEVAGELAFLSGAPRAATLRATRPSECQVIRASSLRVLSYEHPALPMRMARMLARKMSRGASAAPSEH